ncbi:hypothetical protein KFK09_007246 [Dendrobium nobile]|uniref:CCHC-type domain-containing protein n=1 Tax=Dendrobium nobile TaxID=94219 RepID=A0A8T3BRD8_DENNO|nr:hypothetical protein KFK09_007246 [Dendrobium nobile]
MEEVLSGGPWYIGNHIVGMDKWSSSFSPESQKGITSPVWIHFPCLPLSYWDEDNISRIASMIGVPMFLDGNSFKRGKREYAHCCVRTDMERKLPKGVWIEGINGRTFQKVEYEKLTYLCYHCGKVGHNKDFCPDLMSLMIKEKYLIGAKKILKNYCMPAVDDLKQQQTDEYGPWIHADFRNRRYKDVKRNNGSTVQHKQVYKPIGIRVQSQDGLVQDVQAKTVKLQRKLLNSCLNEDCVVVVQVRIQKIPADVCINNKFQILEEVQYKHKAKEVAEMVRVSEGLFNSNMIQSRNDPELSLTTSGKIKLSKELRSVGPVEAAHRKKRSENKNNNWKGDISRVFYPAAWNIALKAWRKADFGNHAEILQRKLRRTLKALHFWNKNKCRELILLKSELKRDILQLHMVETMGDGLTLDKLKFLRSKIQELNVTLARLSTWWNQRAKIRWHEEAKWTARENIFTSWPLIPENLKIIQEDADMLNVDFTKDELINAIFRQGNNKSPGLDAMAHRGQELGIQISPRAKGYIICYMPMMC